MKTKKLLILPLILLLFAQITSGLIGIDEYPSGTQEFNKDEIGPYFNWHITSDQDLKRFTITGNMLLPGFGSCSINTNTGFVITKLMDQDDYEERTGDALYLDQDVNLKIRADILFESEIALAEDLNSWNSSDAFIDGEYKYLCYIVKSTFSDGQIEKDSPYFVVKIYDSEIPPSFSFMSGSMIFVLGFMAIVLIWTIWQSTKNK